MGDPTDDGATPLRTPAGEPLTSGRRTTYRGARGWFRRGDALVGVHPCHEPVAWVPDAERPAFAARARRAEGRDCRVAGDVLLFRLPDGRPVVVVEGPPC